MEVTTVKVSRKCNKKKIRLARRMHLKIKVKAMRQHERVMLDYIHAFGPRMRSKSGPMQADAFWRNYSVAMEWQRRHQITWWRSRCIALEHENEALRNEMRSLAQNPCPKMDQVDYYEGDNDNAQEEMEQKTDEDLEFNITEDMLSFFEQTERHRRELKKHKSKGTICKEETLEETTVVGGAEIARARKEEASLLYGDDAAKILAMETALQATADNYKDKVKPQYWPNIPLKP